MSDLPAYPEVTDWLGEEIAHWKNRTRQANAEVQHLERRVKTQDATIGRMSDEIERLRAKHQAELASLQAHADRFREKDWAHSAEQAKRREQAEAERDVLIDEVKTLQADLDELREAEKRWLQYRRERDALKAAESVWRDAQTGLFHAREDALCRAVAAENEVDALKAAIERVKAIHPRSSMGRVNDYVPIADVHAALEPLEKGAESHGDGRTPQTQGAGETQDAREAQEASQ